jgi:hypothetical protein
LIWGTTPTITQKKKKKKKKKALSAAIFPVELFFPSTGWCRARESVHGIPELIKKKKDGAADRHQTLFVSSLISSLENNNDKKYALTKPSGLTSTQERETMS